MLVTWPHNEMMFEVVYCYKFDSVKWESDMDINSQLTYVHSWSLSRNILLLYQSDVKTCL